MPLLKPVSSIHSPAVSGAPRVWLRLEGAAVFLAATLAYAQGGHGWLLYALLFFVPDVSFAAYLLGPRLGALGYNVLHSYALPLLALAAGIAIRAGNVHFDVAVSVPFVGWHDVSYIGFLVGPLVWLAHIGFDRMLGYGLKYPTAFKDTHLGRI